ncbi:MAG TPA: 2,3-epoxybenzoyl-CoA dihydrolase [Alphaproteobacteria bacterium]
MIKFDTHPERYAHWRMHVDGPVATLVLDVREDATIQPGYRLKLNSYDLGVDIELYDAINRIRFEHPTVKTVVLTSGKERMFCAGANIYMLGLSSHGWKVNFCKFTNETRCGMEDSSKHSGLRFIAALNGTTAGGGYEIALACDEILMVDDRSSTVSLPEVPLLGVLPGTGGLTRLVDKRKVRRDLADLFCTNADGVRAERAKQWRLVDHIATPNQFPELVQRRAEALAATSSRPDKAAGVTLTPLERRIENDRIVYSTLEISLDRMGRTATFLVKAPTEPPPTSIDDIVAQGAQWWPLRLARELDDAILMLRVNEPTIGLWLFRTSGDGALVAAYDESLAQHRAHWFVNETIGWLRRDFQRLDLSSRSLFAIIDRGSAFVGTLFEFALAADRSYMLDDTEVPAESPRVALGPMNELYTMPNGQSRLAVRFLGDDTALQAARAAIGQALDAKAAAALGLITVAPDDLDWEDEIRLAIEERAAMSPDALTGLEASLRFAGDENATTKIFGRLTAWQNWVFSRPNAVGEEGALKVYGTGKRANFDWERI